LARDQDGGRKHDRQHGGRELCAIHRRPSEPASRASFPSRAALLD
jgi:hypothetical protein